ncbi:UDP-N-acetylenolpyruvoylglucosamine reductase [Commensalibacter sp. Nvir]|uniref:UDP-N-acetylmuramate dehydrogenase n=1 Tax=Commensalibacter sp. Nvir TaxID=3069817 RepID=UPI002D6DC142|nr:UDP-N-acetylenolpyruvoylglucosamine reductase [Commensalibacter sp. Nvir]
MTIKHVFTQTAIQNLLSNLQGKCLFNVPIHKKSWFRVGGNLDVLIQPANEKDLIYLLQSIPADWPIFILGATSNLLIRDGGIAGICIQLRKGFNDIVVEEDGLVVGAACLDSTVAEQAAYYGFSGLEFLTGIPGTIGGAIKMNAGAHGSDMASILDWVEIVTKDGNLIRLSSAQAGLSYRHSSLPPDVIIVKARLKGIIGDKAEIQKTMSRIKARREQTQPIRSRTGGSTFRNPEASLSPYKAWQLIDMVNGRGLKIGGAQVSEKHCNFLINTGNATALDIENLGEEIHKRVLNHFGINLLWEIKRVGRLQSYERIN